MIDNCHDCQVFVGEPHEEGCDVARCSVCGGQRLQCEGDQACAAGDGGVWTGEWPGDLECREFDLWSKWTDHGWEETTKDDPAATEDLNRLVTLAAEGLLDWNGQRWVKKGT